MRYVYLTYSATVATTCCHCRQQSISCAVQRRPCNRGERCAMHLQV